MDELKAKVLGDGDGDGDDDDDYGDPELGRPDMDEHEGEDEPPSLAFGSSERMPHGSVRAVRVRQESFRKQDSFAERLQNRLKYAQSEAPKGAPSGSDDVPVVGTNFVTNAYYISLFRMQRQEYLSAWEANCSNDGGSNVTELNDATEKYDLSREMQKILNETPQVKRLRERWITKHVMQGISLYLIFVIILTAAAFLVSDLNITGSAQLYRFNDILGAKSVETPLPFEEESPEVIFFDDIQNPEDFFTYGQTSFVIGLYPDATPGWLDQHNRLIGSPRLLQDRTSVSRCSLTSTNAGDDLEEILLGDPDDPSTDFGQVCFSVAENVTTNIALPVANGTQVTEIFSELESINWIDGATEKVTITYTVVNRLLRLVQVSRLEVEFPDVGDAFPRSQFTVLPAAFLDRRIRAADYFVLLLSFAVLIFIGIEVLEYRSNPKRYVHNRWNVADLTVCSLNLIWCFVLLGARVEAVRRIANFIDAREGDPLANLELFRVGELFEIASTIVSATIVISWAKLIKYFRLLPVLGPVLMSLSGTLLDFRTWVFVLFLIFFAICFGLGVFVRFGAHTEVFRSFPLTLVAIFDSFNGESYFDEMTGLDTGFNSARIGAGVGFWFILSLLATMILANVFINVTGSIYDERQAKSVQAWEDEVNELMLKAKWSEVHDRPPLTYADRLFESLRLFLNRIKKKMKKQLNMAENPVGRRRRHRRQARDPAFMRFRLPNAANEDHGKPRESLVQEEGEDWNYWPQFVELFDEIVEYTRAKASEKSRSSSHGSSNRHTMGGVFDRMVFSPRTNRRARVMPGLAGPDRSDLLERYWMDRDNEYERIRIEIQDRRLKKRLFDLAHKIGFDALSCLWSNLEGKEKEVFAQGMNERSLEQGLAWIEDPDLLDVILDYDDPVGVMLLLFRDYNDESLRRWRSRQKSD
uniref:Polycystin cation channel PKD1/PKD2 domain-containing protein n=1 Tax=Pinguiococcus pyrenoidosus TaxID=172671 RepID=A0A7R9U3C3_9STRA